MNEPQLNVSPHDQRYAEFVRLLSRHHPAILGFVFSLVPNWTDAEDLVQQTSVVLWEKFGEFQPGTDFGRWACTVARFKVMNFLRTQSRDRHVFSGELVEQLADRHEDDIHRLEAERKALSGCLQKLPIKDREPLLDYYAGKETVQALARRRQVTIDAIYKVISRARAALLRCMQSRLAAEGYS